MNEVRVILIKLWIRLACVPSTSFFESSHYKFHPLVKIAKLFRLGCFVCSRHFSIFWADFHKTIVWPAPQSTL